MRNVTTIILAAFLSIALTSGLQAQDSTSVDSIKVEIELPNGTITKEDTLAEGDTLKLGGFPFPLQYLNGGSLSFPDSAVGGNTTITVKLPPFAAVDALQQSIDFGDSLASGVRFEVHQNDTLVDPFEFDTPVELSLPIPENLPNGLGDQVSDLVLSYRTEDGELDTTGVGDVVADSADGIVSAELDHFSDVVMTSDDNTSGETVEEDSLNQVVFKRINPVGKSTTIDTVREGDTLKVAGFPFPFQYLNGAELSLPDSAVSSDIEITIAVPHFAHIDSTQQSISFGDSLASGVTFMVHRGDSLVEPYEFDNPVELSLPIPKNLPSGVGDQVSDLVLSYVNEDGELDTTGVGDIVADSAKGIVKAELDHFSDVAMTSSDNTDDTSTNIADESTTPDDFELQQNYPNPFNPTTQIGFTLPEATNVKLKVYNINGQEIATLVNEHKNSGRYTVTFDATGLSSGVYFYKLRADNFETTKKMLLIK